MTRTRQVVIQELPKGALDASNFALTEADLPAPAEGEALVKTILMSIDAANRAWMQGATYREAVKAGDVMHTYAIAEVVESQDPSLAPGDVVAVESGWTEYAVVKARKAIKLPAVRPLSNLLSVFGIAGKTAYHGLVHVGRPKAGETVLVSAAAGSVGMYVGQIAKALGCRAVGIAGGAEKCRWVVEELGFDACVDYRDPGFFKALKAACPDGVDVYFDNVGGKILETALFLMNLKGRVVCCGAVSQYDETAPSGPRNLPGLVVVKRLRMEGFIVMDFADRDAEANEKLAGWVQSGALKVAEDVVEGLENAPAALIGLLKGENRGKRMVRVAPDPA
ncbi:NADP-dependent oxidoreductase [Albimonas sp. CAU 1670]|uniref:NADP-dependent oxidoreductase n=1 Tax=Albimonas sp. CAU 1670 TaxID=3032599 RepID=UPI0023DC57D6|nr:NADP-dependent oxidoreductase [Albimonas sp. CAU 1670]MDF2233374.1 NADP-dependent oxidoreductase [Albimonas sp. CAU 1670]